MMGYVQNLATQYAYVKRLEQCLICTLSARLLFYCETQARPPFIHSSIPSRAQKTVVRVQWCPRDRDEQDERAQDSSEMRYSMGYGEGEGLLSYIALGEDVVCGDQKLSRGLQWQGLGHRKL
jgi:hypothetical protein